MKNNNMFEKDIEKDFLDKFNFPEKYNFEWKPLSPKIINGSKRGVYFGTLKSDQNECICVKLFEIKEETYKEILKEVYFLVLLKNKDVFVNLDELLLLENKEIIYLIFKENILKINNLFSYKFNYLDDEKLVKWIIYQIAEGLKFLHDNNIIHNDIKPSNILINNKGEIKLCDFGSARYKNEEDSFEYTSCYAPPEFLLNIDQIDQKPDEKSDMWALGVIMVELLIKKNHYFSDENENIENIENDDKILQNILSKFGIDKNISQEEIYKLINDENNIRHINLEKENIKNKEAIKLINNLLVLNPKKRFNAKQVIESDYIKEYKNEIKINGIKDSNKQYEYYKKLNNIKDIEEFKKNYDILNTALKKLKENK